jgi:hypothetical protein
MPCSQRNHQSNTAFIAPVQSFAKTLLTAWHDAGSSNHAATQWMQGMIPAAHCSAANLVVNMRRNISCNHQTSDI